MVWDKSYDPATGGSIRALRNGGFVMAGHFRFNDTGVEGPSVMRLGADGSVVWQAAYPMGWGAYPADIQELSGGDLLVVGTIRTADRYQEMWAMRLLGDGSVVWATDYGSPGMERGSAVVVSGDGRIFLAGSTTSRSGSVEGLVLISAGILELTPRGEIVAQMALRGNETGSVTDLDLTPRGTLVVAGVEQPIGRRIWAAEIDNDWNLLWKRQYAVATFGANVRSTSDGGFIVGSSALGKGHRPWLLKLDRAGGVAGQDCELNTTVMSMALEARERAVEPIYTEAAISRVGDFPGRRARDSRGDDVLVYRFFDGSYSLPARAGPCAGLGSPVVRSSNAGAAGSRSIDRFPRNRQRVTSSATSPLTT